MGIWQCPNCDKWSADAIVYGEILTGDGYVRGKPYLHCPFCGLRGEIKVETSISDTQKAWYCPVCGKQTSDDTMYNHGCSADDNNEDLEDDGGTCNMFS